MAKYLILYNSSVPAREVMAQSTPEQMQASMKEWIDWKSEAEKSVKFEFGMPLQVVGRIIPEGVVDSNNRSGGYSIMEGSKEEVIDLLRSHPHLNRPGASIDVLEMIPMPGMEENAT